MLNSVISIKIPAIAALSLGGASILAHCSILWLSGCPLREYSRSWASGKRRLAPSLAASTLK